MEATIPFEHVLRLDGISPHQPHSFLAQPTSKENESIAKLLGVSRLRKLRLAGRIEQLCSDDWRLEAELGATVTQECVITLEPVVTRIDRPVVRKYLHNAPEPSSDDEAEIDEDDSIEPLLSELDIGAVLIEELALALPAYPRAEGTGSFEARYGPPDTDPLDETGMKPFASLAKLKIPGAKISD